MAKNTIVDEVRRIREGLAARHNFDIKLGFPFWHFGQPQYTCRCCDFERFGSGSLPLASQSSCQGGPCPLPHDPYLLAQGFPGPLSVPSLILDACLFLPGDVGYPAGSGSAAMRRTLLPNNRRVRGLSARRSPS